MGEEGSIVDWRYIDWALDKARAGWTPERIARTATYKAKVDKQHRRQWRGLARAVLTDRRLRGVIETSANSVAAERRRAAR